MIFYLLKKFWVGSRLKTWIEKNKKNKKNKNLVIFLIAFNLSINKILYLTFKKSSIF